MIESESLDDFGWLLGARARGWVTLAQERIPRRQRLGWCVIPEILHDHDTLDARNGRSDLAHARQAVDLLPRVPVAVGAEEHLRLDLSEPVEHTLHPKIRRARRPHGAEARRCEHRDDRLGDVRQEAGDAVADT